MTLLQELVLLYLLKDAETVGGRPAKKSEQLQVIPERFRLLEKPVL